MTTRNLIDIFLESNNLKREQTEAGDRPINPRTVGVVGAGLMGAGIAQASAMAGLSVRIHEVNADAVATGLKRIHDLMRRARRSGRIDRYEAARVANRVSGSTTYAGFGRAGLVIEAALEDLAVKRTIVAELEAILPAETVIGTNTSALPIADIAAQAEHPERVVGVHLFSPVHRMPLIEVVRGPLTSEKAVETAIGFGHRLGKNVVVVGDGPGFYTTRVLGFMMAEAVLVFEEGAAVEDIDRAMTDFGFPVGPMTLMDEVGLNVALHVAKTLTRAFPHRLQAPQIMTGLAAAGRAGKKSGRGFYLYRTGKKTVDPAVNTMEGRGARLVPQAEIQERLSLVFVNEAARCLSEGIVSSARDADLAAIFGLGFPPFLGGPLRYADLVGTPTIVERLRLLEEKFGSRFAPAPVLHDATQGNEFLRESSRSNKSRARRGLAGEIVGLRNSD